MTVSFQLYSARDFQPWDRVIVRLAQLGYKATEGFGGVYEDPPAFRALLDDHGIAMPSGHFNIEMIEAEFGKVTDICRVLGIGIVCCPFIMPDDRPADAGGWRELGLRLAAIGEKVASAGLTFAWHNHDFEFTALPGGEIPMALILEAAPGIGWEADIAWIARSGADPFDWIERYDSRIVAVHVKDIAPPGQCIDEDGWADVGHGTLPWSELIERLKSSSSDSLLIVEHDNPSDIDRFARRSMNSMRQFGA